MPYGGTSKSQDKKIENCVNDLMANRKFKGKKTKNNPTGDRKSSAIAICKSQVMKKR